jgi:hypothetical protein
MIYKEKYNFILTIPTLNESLNVITFYQAVKKILKKNNFFIIFIDDSKNSKTKNEIKKYFKNYEYKIIKSSHNQLASSRGLASWTGLKFAYKNFNYNFIWDIDIDLVSMLSSYKDVLINIKKKNDIIIYSKYENKSKVIGRSLFRVTLSKAVNKLTKYIFPYRINDYTSLRVYSYNVSKFLVNKYKLKYSSPIHNLDLLIFLLKKNYFKINHIPFYYKERLKGSSTVNFLTLAECFIDYLNLVFIFYLKKLKNFLLK